MNHIYIVSFPGAIQIITLLVVSDILAFSISINCICEVKAKFWLYFFLINDYIDKYCY